MPASVNAIDRLGAADLEGLGVDYVMRPKLEGTKRILEALQKAPN